MNLRRLACLSLGLFDTDFKATTTEIEKKKPMHNLQFVRKFTATGRLVSSMSFFII